MNASWRRYLGFWGARVEHDVDDELSFHMDMLVRDYVARGMSKPDARRAAERRLGNIPRTRSACLTIGQRRQRRMARAQTLDALQQDLRYALRTLGRARSWTTIALPWKRLPIHASTTGPARTDNPVQMGTANPRDSSVPCIMMSRRRSPRRASRPRSPA